jgi:hypothetical protein
VDGTNFIGTTNNVPFNIRVNNVTAGRIESTTGSNTFLGFRSGLSNTGSNNTAMGVNALDGLNGTTFNSGNNNTAFGYNTLQSNTTGIENTALGYQALYTNQTTGLNTAVGKGALYLHGSLNTIGITGNTAVGYEALYRNNPSDGTDGKWNTALGYNAGDQNITGTGNTFIGTNAGDNITTGDDNTFLGFGANATLGTWSNATAIGAGASVNADDKVRIGNNSVTVIEGQVAFTAASDRRLKSDIRTINYGLDFIKKLTPVSYKLNDSDGRESWGFIAQDIEELIGTDKAVLTIGHDEMRTLGLRYTDFIAPMVKAIQEQQDQIEALKAQLKDKDDKVLNLESSVNSMKEELETIKRALGMEASSKSSSKN